MSQQVIIMSATMDADKFSRYFSNAPVLQIPGRRYPVEIFHTKVPHKDYLLGCVRLVEHIHTQEGHGDILVFLCGEEDVDRVCAFLRHKYNDLAPIPLYSRMAPELQAKIHSKSEKRKCIVSTNIAETSLTIDGVVYVVDSGLSKQSLYNPRAALDSLTTRPISKASAIQRAGRAGRTQAGVCYRLYTQEGFDGMLQSNFPGISCERFTSGILTLKDAGVSKIMDFDFLDFPSPETVMRGLEDLHHWEYLDAKGAITPAGRLASRLPVDPIWYRAIIVAGYFECTTNMLSIAAVCSTQQPIFARPRPHQNAANLVKSGFQDMLSDHMTLLNAFNAWLRMRKREDVHEWCFVHFLNPQALEEANNILESLLGFMAQNFNITGVKPALCRDTEDWRIRAALATAFFTQVAMHHKGKAYRTVPDNVECLITADSALARVMTPHDGFTTQSHHQWVVYQELHQSGRQYIRIVSAIKPEWIAHLPFFESLPKKYNGEWRQAEAVRLLGEARTRRLEL